MAVAQTSDDVDKLMRSSKKMGRRLLLEVEQYESKHGATTKVPQEDASPQSVLDHHPGESPQSVIDPLALPRKKRMAGASIGLRLECAEFFDEAAHEYLLRALWARAGEAMPDFRTQMDSCASGPYRPPADSPPRRSSRELTLAPPLAAVSNEPFARFSHRWETVLGFQTDDPVRDLRGARALGLKQLVHFCTGSSGANLEIVKKSRTSFPLAVASLNVTLVLTSHLGLLSTPAGGAGATPQCSEETLRNFLRLHNALSADGHQAGDDSTSTALDLMHEQCLRWLLDRWEKLEMPSGTPHGLRLMQFPRLLDALREHVQCTLASVSAPWSIGSVLVALRQGSRNDVPPALEPKSSKSWSVGPGMTRAIGLAVLVAWWCPPVPHENEA